MLTIRVDYHREGDAWWADSPDVAGFVASGSTLTEVRELVQEGLPFYLDGAPIELIENAPWASGVVVDVHLTIKPFTVDYSNVGAAGSVVPHRVTDHVTVPSGATSNSSTYERVAS